jgi:hypothetical protein
MGENWQAEGSAPTSFFALIDFLADIFQARPSARSADESF